MTKPNILNAEKDAAPLLPLVPIERDHSSEQLQSFKLKVNPVDANSPMVQVYVPFLHGTEDIRAGLETLANLEKVWTGLAAADGPAKDRIAEQIYKDSALTQYKSRRDEHLNSRKLIAAKAVRDAGANAGETDAAFQARVAQAATNTTLANDDVAEGCRGVIEYLCPTRALARIKRYLRRKCRKPLGMKVKEFHNHLQRINNLELPKLPPRFSADQKLADDEVIDIVLHAVPNKWQVELQRKGIDPYDLHNSHLLCAKLENIEAAEELDNTAPRNGSNNNNAKKNNSAKKNPKSSKADKSKDKGQFYCLHHGENNTHDTNDCFVLKKMVASVDKDKKKGGTNKKSDKKGEAHALSKKVKTMRAEINALQSKKRKLEEDIQDAEVMALDNLDAITFEEEEDMSVEA